MTWFSRDHTDRGLSEVESTFVHAVRALLTELAPPQLEPSQTLLAAEGDRCLILLLPHRALGGIALAITLCAGRADLGWAQVTRLDYHDDLDLALSVAQFSLEGSRPEFAPVLRSIREQLAAPIALRLFDDRATVYVLDARGERRKVGEIGGRVGWPREQSATPHGGEVIVRFTDAAPPPVSVSPSVDAWFGIGDGGA
jgi:hypothetical protein